MCDRKVDFFYNLAIFGWHVGTCCLRMTISAKEINPRNLATLVHFFHQNPLNELYGIIFCCQVANICNIKKLLLVSYIFCLFTENKLFILPTMNTQYIKSIWNVNLNSSCKWSSLISNLIIKQKLQSKLVVSSRHCGICCRWRKNGWASELELTSLDVARI
jgi:hypothetical protein